MIVNEVLNTALSGTILPTQERMIIADSIRTLRNFEIKKDIELEMVIRAVYRECRDEVMARILCSVIANQLRFVDVSIIMDMLMTDARILGAWEYESMDATDALLSLADEAYASDGSESTKGGISSADILASMCDFNGCDCNE